MPRTTCDEPDRQRRRPLTAKSRPSPQYLGDAGGHASFPTIMPSTVVGSKLHEILQVFYLPINWIGTQATLDFL